MDVNYFSRPQDKEVAQILDPEKLKKLRRDRYSAAYKLGITGYLALLANRLGEEDQKNKSFLAGDAKVLWVRDPFQWHCGHTEVYFQGKLVFCSRVGDRLIIPGFWLSVLLEYKEKVENPPPLEVVREDQALQRAIACVK